MFPVVPVVVEALQANAFQKDYQPVKGLPELRDAVSRYYCRARGVEFSGDDVLIGPGSKELMFLLQLVYYGDLGRAHANLGVLRAAGTHHRASCSLAGNPCG